MAQQNGEKAIERFIRQELKTQANPKRAEHDKRYVNSQIASFGCPIPHVRKVAKQLQKKFDLTHAQWRRVLNKIWKTANNQEIMTVCLFYFEDKELTLADWRLLKTWVNRIDNWAHSDVLSSLYAKLLETHRNDIFPVFKIWNDDKHPWKRRLSLTSLYYYANSRDKLLPVSLVLPLVKKRLQDEHFYVQRAVGWTLRECSNVDAKKTLIFIEKHLTTFSSIAFTTAIEKYPKTEKERLKQLRKSARASRN